MSQPMFQTILAERTEAPTGMSDMCNHQSVLSLFARFKQDTAFVEYYSKDYPLCQGKSQEWVASFVILDYLEFLLLLKKELAEDRYMGLSPPLLLDVVWHEHILDTRGYHDFCNLHIGAMLHHDPNKALLEFQTTERAFRIVTTVLAYTTVPSGAQTLLRLKENGMWWPQLTSVSTPLTVPVPPSTSQIPPVAGEATEKISNKGNKRTRGASSTPVAKHLKRTPSTPLKVQVKTLTGRVVTCVMNEDSTMHDVILEFCRIDGGWPDKANLIYNGKRYYGQKPSCTAPPDTLATVKADIEHKERVLTLKELDIHSDTMFHHVLSLRGC
ncbi:hypothetical protein CYMTET_3020 [Cymbomonas tetramitiformis]|uniref:Uncharacterized protein n=1 Tax=Cymbomonas tetramitiformis TaxID=36881 RepID=A0AAE0H440_9CHLO|nr:hypothetical protein CYMTET_3020 [Cymbomonas tetramitiformis]